MDRDRYDWLCPFEQRPEGVMPTSPGFATELHEDNFDLRRVRLETVVCDTCAIFTRLEFSDRNGLRDHVGHDSI